MSPLSNTLHQLGGAAACCDSAEFERRYGPSLRRIVRHMLISGGGPAAWRPWLTEELKLLPPQAAAAPRGGEETVRRLTHRLSQALLRPGPRLSESRFETLAAV